MYGYNILWFRLDELEKMVLLMGHFRAVQHGMCNIDVSISSNVLWAFKDLCYVNVL